MANRYSLKSVLADCDKIVRVWTDNPDFALGEITLAGLQAEMADARAKSERLESMQMQMTALKNDLDATNNSLSGKRTRALSGFRAVYGPNSTQYEQAGGTRQSEKRKTTRKGGGSSGDSNK
jgi:hypothetical protein